MVEASFEGLFNPSGIAVVGASRNPSKIGSIILKNLRITYRGRLYSVNPNAEEIQGIKTHSKIKDIKESVDIAIIALPAEAVLPVLKDCEKKKVKFAIVISSGFEKDKFSKGKLEAELVKFLSKTRIKIIGPDSIGIMNANPAYNATFLDPNLKLKEGKAAFLSQNGYLMGAILDDASLKSVGFSKVINVGDEFGLDMADMVEVLSMDDKSGVIAIYLEELRDAKKFVKSAVTASERKPIVVIKGSRSEQEEKHYDEFSLNEGMAYDLLFKRCGIIKAPRIRGLLALMRDAPVLKIKSDEVIVITNARAAGLLTAGYVKKNGLRLAKFSNNVINELSKILPKEAELINPLDILGNAKPEQFGEVLEALIKLNKPILVLFSPQESSMPIETSRQIAEISKKNPEAAILPVFLGGTRVEKAKLFFKEMDTPVYSYPEEATEVIKGMYDYACFKPPTYSAYDKIKKSKVSFDKKNGITGLDAKRILDKIGVNTVKGVSVKKDSELKQAAERIGFPCVIKADLKEGDKPGIRKVITGIKNAEELTKHFNELRDYLGREKIKVDSYSVYEDVSGDEDGTNLKLSIVTKGSGVLGPLTRISDGRERSFTLLAPFTDKDISDFKNSALGKEILAYAKNKVLETVTDTMIRISKFVDSNDDVDTVEIDPFFVSSKNATAANFKII